MDNAAEQANAAGQGRNNEAEDGYRARPREFKLGPLVFNPVVTILGIVILWSFAIWAMVDQQNAKAALEDWKAWISWTFTWLYIGSQDVWIIFLFVVYYKFGHVKLGPEDAKPEFSNVSYFMMIYSCGVAVGLFFYGVSEPLYHLSGNRYAAAGYHTDNEKAQQAINLTLYHWGLHGWCVYCLVAVLMGFCCYLKGLPMTMRSCLHPMIGNQVNGWVGDIIDAMSIVVVVFGVCTSLGLGAMQIVTGLTRLQIVPQDASSEVITNTSLVVIWIITAVAATSVALGVHRGIKPLSQLGFLIAVFLWFVVFILDDTWYMLNVLSQSIGYHFQWLMQLGWHCDAFEYLKGGYCVNATGAFPVSEFQGVALDNALACANVNDALGKSSVFQWIPSVGAANDGKSANPAWMSWWTIFYWGWWIAWSPFVGTFLARISRNRTVREVINYSLCAPLLYAFLWFAVFGGAGIKMHRAAIEQEAQATLLGVVEQIKVEGFNHGPQCFNSGPVQKNGVEVMAAIGTSSALGPLHGPVCKFDYSDADGIWFDLLQQYHGLGDFLSVVTIIGIILYFVTSSDSGSLVVDMMSSNGDMHPHIISRLFWSVTEGAVATGLIVSGGADALKALQAASICSGLPYTFFLCIMCTCLWRALDKHVNPEKAETPKWKFAMLDGIFDAIEFVFSLGSHSFPAGHIWWNFVLAVLCPVWLMWGVVHKCNNQHTLFGSIRMWNNGILISSAIFFFGFIVLYCVWAAVPGLYGLAWISYAAFTQILAIVRNHIRTSRGIDGNVLEDCFTCLLAYPQVICQLHYEDFTPPPAQPVIGLRKGSIQCQPIEEL
jgi:choline-glycine betaine transporter|uniref:Transporter n=1 Tax=Eutreptiella gymnastica TaxID=73025 RepID=A0A7S4CB01_9EUGL|mmetsp:Transcript_74484/g.125479  ORF Transcript_74484/g.125479 Transcript_74484/m.125479 type:complete len:828 (+) Transcript_74484:45-2528(+)|eukprot:CAMPEP_0174284848 /NCGR_PEP_ID=MMETSP0809-20121228/6855_1 /TAXON_ID=73025 ORGANISM="Eutreptiella gymnastica-like, Strain CCMP1594" /NCGR_SAMPLE_ID=MMETSP0809 /ASSEMBLY_ACC=CAM_ASM_000658 /LENGTH=827 /DNA_ID=CAMNT_0015380497 /DNA_START=45 /DNA_END=2528 /DNA_ORIENTATION=+